MIKKNFVFLTIFLLSIQSVFATNEPLELGKKYYSMYLKNKNSELSYEYLDYARKYYIRAVQKEPSAIEIMIELSKVYFEQKNYDKMNEILRTAKNMQPQNASVNYLLGLCYYNQARYLEALKLLLLSYKSGNSKDFETVFYISNVYEKLSDSENSLKYLNEAILINPNSKKAKEKLETVKKAQEIQENENIFDPQEEQDEFNIQLY